ncbi:MAG: hypothetical protein AAGG53_13655 [Cyanobacteria bacterium P01_H01_bin.152]
MSVLAWRSVRFRIAADKIRDALEIKVPASDPQPPHLLTHLPTHPLPKPGRYFPAVPLATAQFSLLNIA